MNQNLERGMAYLMKNYVISMYNKGQNEAGPKAKVDAEDFLAQDGFEKVNFYFSGARKAQLLSIKQRLWDIPQKIKKITPGLVVFQYPTFDSNTDQAIISELKKHDELKLVYLIHDIESLRAYRGDAEYTRKEIAFLNQSDGLIVHNAKMKAWLSEKGVKKPMVSLEIFDYANPVPLQTKRPFNGSICYAGNLQKADFLQELQLQHPLALYGPNQAKNYPQNISYKGSFTPEKLPEKLTQNFGLIWDGASINECSGSFGEYLKYNDPHKTSLYLSSGLPVIIWKKAALADFVNENKVGICLDSLAKLDESLNVLSLEEYQKMWTNAQNIAKKMRTGAYLKAAVAKISQLIEVEK